MFMHFPYSLQYAVLVHVHWIYGAAVGVDVVGSVGARKVEERHTGIQGAEEWEAGSHPKKGQKKNTPFHTFHTLVRVMNAIQSYISTSYMTSIFFALKANEVDKSARWSQNVPRS